MKKQDIKRIEKIKERADRATSGKWMVEKYYHDEPYEEYIKSAAVITGNSTITRNDWSNPVEADLDFIANARQDIPYLLDKIDELYALNRELAERRTPKKVKEHYNWCDFTEEEKLENHHWFCENCTAPVEEHHNYCSECGQKLDWRVE